MASRRNPMRPVPRLRDVLERIERNEVKRRLLGMPVADPFLDLDLGTSPDAEGAAPAAVAPFGFAPPASPVRNPRRMPGTLSFGGNTSGQVLLGGTNSDTLAPLETETFNPRTRNMLSDSPRGEFGRQDPGVVTAGGDLTFPRGPVEADRRRRRRTTLLPSLPSPNPMRRQVPEPIRDRSAEFARVDRADADAQKQTELLEHILSRAEDEGALTRLASELRLIFPKSDLLRARAAEKIFPGIGFALDPKGNLLAKLDGKFFAFKRPEGLTAQRAVDAVRDNPLNILGWVLDKGFNEPFEKEALENLVRRIAKSVIGRERGLETENFVPTPRRTDGTFASIDDLVGHAIRQMKLRARRGFLLREDRDLLRNLGADPSVVEEFLIKTDEAGRLLGPV